MYMKKKNSRCGGNKPVKSTGWLIKKQQSGPHQNLKSYADPPLFSTTDPTQMPIPNNSISTILEPHLYNCAFNKRTLLRPRHFIGKTKSSRVGNRFPNRQRTNQVVILSDIRLKTLIGSVQNHKF